MILMYEILKSLPDAEAWYNENGPDHRFCIGVTPDREPLTLSRHEPVLIQQSRQVELRVVKLIRYGNYAYDWEMLV